MDKFIDAMLYDMQSQLYYVDERLAETTRLLEETVRRLDELERRAEAEDYPRFFPESEMAKSLHPEQSPDCVPETEDLCQSCTHEQTCALWARKCDIVTKCFRYDLCTWPPR